MNRVLSSSHGCAGWFEGGTSTGIYRSKSTRTWPRPQTSTCSRGCHLRRPDGRRFAASAASRRFKRCIETCARSRGWRMRDGISDTRSEPCSGHLASLPSRS